MERGRPARFFVFWSPDHVPGRQIIQLIKSHLSVTCNKFISSKSGRDARAPYIPRSMPSKDPHLFRLNRAVAASGLCSRRNADELIKSGRVRVNGRQTTDFNCLVDLSKDKLEIDGKMVTERKLEYIVLHKPSGIVTTCDDEKGRQSVIDLLPRELRHLKPVGRLDMDSEGLLIMTNDGDLAQQLTHPSRRVLKLYEVRVVGRISDTVISQLGK